MILRYCSRDGLAWKYDGIVEECRNEIGKMWECPDYFALDGKQVLLFSPQEVAEGNPEFRIGFNTVAMTGSTDDKTRRFLREHVQAVDYGFEFYAPQTTETKDGRRIMTAWMYDWAVMGEIKSDRKWNGQMILPRELSVRNGRLCQRPVREIENYYGECTGYPQTQIADFPQISSSCMDLSIKVRHAETWFRRLTMHITEDAQNELLLTYVPSDNAVILVHKEHGAPHDRISERRFSVSDRGGDMDLRILIDKFSAEIFINDGEQTVTAETGNHSEVKTISFSCEGDALISGVKHDLQFGS
ncbi:MAG: GH32 C-terminal domain-containing protein [Solobacterium sp.]|nr:GH32 C-terminal domain-containing protein [Solobacterium sp.]